ncbi:MAG: helix-turn-helix domain-containing protein [Myxococcota bacterium]
MMTGSSVQLTLVGRMKVVDFAQVLGMSIEQVVALVVCARERVPGRAAAGRGLGSHRPAAPGHRSIPGPRLSPSGGMAVTRRTGSRGGGSTSAEVSPRSTVAGVTHRQVHEAVDRWLLAEALERHHGNITHTATELGLSRKRMRERWAEVRPLEPRAMTRVFKAIKAPVPAPSIEQLRARVTHAGVHDEVDRWLLEQVFLQESQNLTHAAQRLHVSRRYFRERRAKLCSA